MLIKLNPLFTWARSSINRAGTAWWGCVIFGQGEAHRLRCSGCGVTSRLPRGHYCHGCCPMERALGTQAACSLFTPVLGGNTHQPSAPGQASCSALISILVTLFMGFHCPCAPVWHVDVLDSKCFRQQRKTVPCLFKLKAFPEVSNSKYWLDSVNHSHYSCLFSTASPRDSHPLH